MKSVSVQSKLIPVANHDQLLTKRLFATGIKLKPKPPIQALDGKDKITIILEGHVSAASAGWAASVSARFRSNILFVW
eukprot:gene6150-biopygen13536